MVGVVELLLTCVAGIFGSMIWYALAHWLVFHVVHCIS